MEIKTAYNRQRETKEKRKGCDAKYSKVPQKLTFAFKPIQKNCREAALREIKERAKQDKKDKATARAANKDKAAKVVPKGAGKGGAKSTGR